VDLAPHAALYFTLVLAVFATCLLQTIDIMMRTDFAFRTMKTDMAYIMQGTLEQRLRHLTSNLYSLHTQKAQTSISPQ
jgi:hypothetical protein